ncbi:TPA: hypothetical protein ACP3ZG_004803 [Pseudomonas aeruginosa]|uniref:hypothetical protein n=1 Tax=Pseudomonas TaxID=286 RepID=UPI0011476DC1|nr:MULTISPECIES: hypothetical protein [Pseudomonas]ELG7182301.1 hypothetical protein [Pseudomonas aeruginosa]MBI6605610.1 hypothetical protein [Pseudomonas sp. S4_EA_1b]MBI8852320.1 hypothetical protein [Pseudomonas aeruginosa]HCF9659981.1 hypothetical protein [Pseudomonas aeruginosa]HDU2622501.1 hypothetical protein [Pseudomonas aeruginosa]
MACVSFIHPYDPNRSTILEELDAMDWQFSQLARLLTEIEKTPDAYGRDISVREARRRLDTLLQRSYRANQIARGLRVPKAN